MGTDRPAGTVEGRTDSIHFLVNDKCAGDARTQSPPTKNYAPEFPTFGEIASFNRAKCKAAVST